MRAIDLYAGVGGWSLGLSMAGVEVVASYEWWHEANLTNYKNNKHRANQVNIRSLDPAAIPKVDIVVGSPPCTQFSLANRGGRGDVLEGLKDVEKFLEIVEAVGPRFWALENVPRLAEILRSELNQGGELHRFARLNPSVAVLDCSEWGVPQRRKRAIIGNFDLDLLLSYRSSCRTTTLGDVIDALSSDPAVDPVYGTLVPATYLVDHAKEDFLSKEEERINRDNKSNHPVYNGMSFPDDLGRPSRTVTATCTRVSRESIVVPEEGGFRRLTLRERASLQSFPASYQFYGTSNAQKQKMIGNALPPLLSYYIGNAMLGVPPHEVPSPKDAVARFSPPSDEPPPTRPDRSRSRHDDQRRFRAAIPGLRFKSGVRFELSNEFRPGGPQWRVRFFYGDSKKRHEVDLGSPLLKKMEASPGVRASVARANNIVVEGGGILNNVDPRGLQARWAHCRDDYLHPHDLVDSIDAAVKSFLEKDACPNADVCVGSLLSSFGTSAGHKKLMQNSKAVFAGMVVGSIVNEILEAAEAK